MIALAAVLGFIAGTVFSAYGTYYTCVLIDAARGTEGGDGLVTVGWLFLVVTVPVGGVIGAFSFVAIAKHLFG